ncbi:MAG TPA: cytochrome c [Acidimicrobiia bacterium]|nr:cytochrome c [Acidimicrobiia bacterium]
MARRRRGQPSRPSGGNPRRASGWLLWVGLAVVLGGVIAVALSVAGDDPGPAGGSGDVVAGEALYLANCAVCHGADLQGTVQGPPFLDVIYAPNHHPDEAFQRAVASGVVPHHWNFGPMLPMPSLSRDEVASIIAFVRSHQQAAGIVRDPSHP